jgi:sugar transferase EpsL
MPDYKFLKRVIDFICALSGLFLFFPILVAVAILVRFRLGSPVFFIQERAGLKGMPFRMIKFRSMTDERDSLGNLLPDDKRLTPFGKFLRSSSLDELSELVNVLKGDMSLVGPRPLPTLYLPRYSKFQARRHEVKPGITGWAQINGRNNISWDDKLKLDVWYVEHQSLRLDVSILFRTVKQVLLRKDISETGQATASEFRGQ